MLADLRALSPRPLAGDGPSPAPPELELTAAGDVRLTAPQPLAGSQGSAEDQAAARALVAAVEARGRTLLRIARRLVRLQAPWLRGEADLRALSMTALAAELELSKSTVSRAVAGVAMRTPRGTLALRDLLRPPASPLNPAISRESALAALRALIAEWPPGRRISDARLAQALAEQGIRLSRRTVAKWRAGLQGSRG
nr:hypothetical protein [Paracoccus binzhouensis]